ncbi:GSCFA domain-containing protein [Roseovarius aestuariivivens]|uniref:GSCFA domain-containing protein n=1 Tax=Roseovarius aestuariivivens TaxID=1888910 RepID=UPI0010807601|nr:GSCFA domain-containing protein [Roseovarius aestuariivivens]
MSNNPYKGLPESAFWSAGVAHHSPFEFEGLYSRKWRIQKKTQVATAGSCFAQHIARNLRARKFSVLDMEPAPPGLPEEDHLTYGYGTYSCRYGNIYTARQLLQLLQEATGAFEPQDIVWEKDGRFYDALRPAVEPEGLPTAEEVRAQRRDHLTRVRAMIEQMDLFVFTLGLTEAWEHVESGTIYPTAPGTIAGFFDPDKVRFKNFGFAEIRRDLDDFLALAREMRGGRNFRVLLTVSPVPLTATASGGHVLKATTYSKSVLRAVAGHFESRPNIDYFPSYEIITNPAARGLFYESNLRSVRATGVETVMKVFFDAHGTAASPQSEASTRPRTTPEAVAPQLDEDVQCEDALLEQFAR